MKPRHLTLLLAVFLTVSSISLAAATRPNIVFILTDDQATWTTSGSGNPQAVTPHLDRLAQQGASFSHAFVVTPVCSPSRVELMTGRYGTEMGILDFLVMPRHKKLKYDSREGLRADVPTFPEVFPPPATRPRWSASGTWDRNRISIPSATVTNTSPAFSKAARSWSIPRSKLMAGPSPSRD